MIEVSPILEGLIGQTETSSVSVISVLGGVAVSFASAVLVYTIRQYWERKKLERALITEVEEMAGIKHCADQMDRIEAPPTRQLRPDDVPTSDSIPTTVYRNSTSKIGLMGGFGRVDELRGVVRFYSKIIRYKSIISEIDQSKSGNSASESDQSQEDDEFNSSVSDNDQEHLFNDINELEEVRQEVIDTGSFDVEYPAQLDD